YRADDVRVMQTKQPIEFESIGQKEGQPKGYLHVKKVPLRDDAAQSIGVLLLFWDMTVFRATDDTLKIAQRELVETPRLAGMAELATNILHNLGNALNSVTTSAGLAAERVRAIQTSGISKLAQLLREQGDRIAEFFATDPRAA